MHPHNRFSKPYDFVRLVRAVPDLGLFVVASASGTPTIDFSQPAAVRLLNKALLLDAYQLNFWDLPVDALCPAVPSRLEYVHLVADLLKSDGRAVSIPTQGLDIGTGASLIYPILGVREYGWHMVGTEIDRTALRAAKAIVKFNRVLAGKVELRLQQPKHIFTGVIAPQEQFAFTLCNPPFFASAKQAAAATQRKWQHLGAKSTTTLNFGGQAHELWTPGGEPAFLKHFIRESFSFRQNVRWFTTLVSQRRYLKDAQRQLQKAKATYVRVLSYSIGNKSHQVLAWRWGEGV